MTLIADEKLTNKTVKAIKTNSQVKPGNIRVQQKASQFPYLLHKNAGKEINESIKGGHLETVNIIEKIIPYLP